MATNYNDYSKTTWINSSAPALNETNLNKIEQGIYDNRENTQELKSHSIYSTNETIIGTWIDNKPIYRKVYKITSGLPAVDTTSTLSIADLNVERCLTLRGWTYNTTYGFINLNFYNNGSYNFTHLVGNTTISYRYHWLPTELYFIIEYTKTTD